MANIYGAHFEYNGVSSRERGLIIAAVDQETDERMAGEIASKTLYNPAENRLYYTGSDYSGSPLTFDVSIVNDRERPLEASEQKFVRSWLLNKSAFAPLYIDMADDPGGEMVEWVDGERKRSYFNCRFLNPRKLEYNGGTVGYAVTMETDSGLLWQEPVTKAFELNPSDAEYTLEVNVDTDLDDFVYPTVTVTTGEGIASPIRIESGGKVVTIFSIESGKTVVIEGGRNLAQDDDGIVRYVQGGYVRLFPGENAIAMTGNLAKVTVTYQARRML